MAHVEILLYWDTIILTLSQPVFVLTLWYSETCPNRT